MGRNRVQVFLHLVWGTWDQQWLIPPEIERPLHRSIEQEARPLGCTVLAVNGIEDHVHVVLTLPTTSSISDLLKQIKGVSSKFVNDTLKPAFHFKWQGGYGVQSVSPRNVDQVVSYVKRQKEHHAANTLYAAYEPRPLSPNPTGK